MTTDGSVNTLRRSGFMTEHHVSIYLTNKHHVTFARRCIRKMLCFFLQSQIPFGSACVACHKLRACKNALIEHQHGWGCCPSVRSVEVIVICIRLDALAPKARRLNKHLEIVCVHLSLLFFVHGGDLALVLRCTDDVLLSGSSLWQQTTQTSQQLQLVSATDGSKLIYLN